MSLIPNVFVLAVMYAVYFIQTVCRVENTAPSQLSCSPALVTWSHSPVQRVSLDLTSPISFLFTINCFWPLDLLCPLQWCHWLSQLGIYQKPIQFCTAFRLLFTFHFMTRTLPSSFDPFMNWNHDPTIK